ncbi:MAG: insulinase family protein [Myxococcota bacterium]
MLALVTAAPAQEAYAFASGLRVVLAPEAAAPRVSTSMVLDAGALDDPEGREGVAHLVEHLWFDSRDANGPTAWDTLQALGCHVGASTWPEYTEFRAACPALAVDDLLALELRRLHRPLANVDEADLTLARRVVLAEEAEDGRGRVMASRLMEALYPADHPLHDWARRPELAPRLSRHDVDTFAGIHYVPANATLAITGGFRAEAVLRVLEARLGPALADPPARTPRRVPPPFRRAIRLAARTIEAPVSRAAVTLAWSLPPGRVGGFEREALLDLVGNALHHAFRYDRRVVALGCGDLPSSLATPLTCGLELADDADADDVAAALRFVADGLWWGGNAARLRAVFPAARSQHAVAVREAAHRHDAAMGGSAGWLALSALLGGDADPFARSLDAARHARVGDLLDVAREHLAPDRALVIVWRPAPKGPPAPLRGEDPVAVAHPVAPVAPAVVPAISAAARRLPNGLEVLAVQRADVVQLHAAARVAWGEGLDGAAEVVAWRSDGHTPTPLLRDVLPFDGDDARGALHGVIGDATDAEIVLRRLRERVGARTVHLDVREPWLDRARILATRRAERAAYWAEALPLAALDVTGDAAARIVAADLDAMTPYLGLDTRATVSDRARARYRPENTELVLVGPGSPEAALEAAARVFEGWSVPEGDAGEPLAGHAADVPPLVVVDDPDARQALLAWRCPVRGEAPARALAGELVNVGVFDALRARTGWAYGPWGAVEAITPETFHLAVGASVPVDRVAAALAAVEGVVRGLPDLDDDAIARAREAWLWRTAPAFATPGALAGLALDPEGLRSPADLAGWVAAVRAVDGRALGRVLDGCLDHARVGVAGPAAGIAPELAAAGRPAEVWAPAEARARVAAPATPTSP